MKYLLAIIISLGSLYGGSFLAYKFLIEGMIFWWMPPTFALIITTGLIINFAMWELILDEED